MVDVEHDPTAGWRVELSRLGRVLTAGVLSGAMAGFLVGGIGGRLVMFVLRLTSSDAVRGLETDDGFDIGVVSSGTLFLLAATTALGAVGGLAYVAIRTVLWSRGRALVAACLAGLVGGAAILDEEGIDFQLLDPLWFAVVAFIALPAAYGWVLSRWVERRLARPSGSTSLLTLLPLAALLLVGPSGIVLVLLVLGGVAIAVRRPDVYVRLRSPGTWLGRAVLLAVSVVALIEVVDDVGAIL